MSDSQLKTIRKWMNEKRRKILINFIMKFLSLGFMHSLNNSNQASNTERDLMKWNFNEKKTTKKQSRIPEKHKHHEDASHLNP